VGFVGGLIASLAALAVVLGGWTMVLSHGYDPPSGPVESASGARPTRQQVVDAALSDIGPPASHHEVSRQYRVLSAGTVVSYLPTGEAGGDHRTELLSAWVERSTVTFAAATDVPTFLACAAHLGDGDVARCTLVGQLRDQRIEFTVADDVVVTSCGPPSAGESGYRVELFSGAAPSGQAVPTRCRGGAAGILPTG